MRVSLLTLTCAIAAASIPCAAIAAIPMFNGTCPGGMEVHADEGGPVFVNGRQTQLKRFNDNYYEARDSDSGVTLSINPTADGGLQMSYTGRNGANGVCSVGNAAEMAPPSHDQRGGGSGDQPREVTCESVDRSQVECDMDTRGDVQLVRQISKTRCEQGRNWGLNRHSVWVSDGCRAVFRNVSSSPRSSGGGASGDALLASCNDRVGAQGSLVTKVPVNDQTTELIIDYPDGRFLCMISNEGAVQSLTRIRKR